MLNIKFVDNHLRLIIQSEALSISIMTAKLLVYPQLHR